MVRKLKDEWHFVVLLLLTQVSIFLWNYREFETKFFPVVENYHVAHVIKQTENSFTVLVSFDKVRDCEYVSLTARRPDGYILDVSFDPSDIHISRPTGKNLAGPWTVNHDSWSDIQVETLHRCDPFGFTRTYLQLIKW